MCGLTTITASLILLFGQHAADESRNSIEIRQARSYEAFKEFHAISEALKKGGERGSISKQFLGLADRCPETDRGKEARELAALLQQMAEEDRQFHTPRNADSLSQGQVIALHIYTLRDVAAADFSVPGSIEVLRDSHDPNSPAVALRKIGKPAVPALIDLLADRRPTRSVGAPFNGTYVLRHGDVALQILQSITGQRFTDLRGTGWYLSNRPEAWQEQVRLQIRRWWEANRDKDESQWLRESLSQSGIAAFWYTLELAERLVELEGSKSIDFFRDRLRAEPNDSFIVSLLWKAGGRQVIEDIRPKIHHKSLAVRMAAYQVLLDAGEPNIVDIVIADFAKVMKRPYREPWDHGAFIYVLAKTDSEKAVLLAAKMIGYPDPSVVEGVLMAFESTLMRAGKPAPHLRHIVVPYMVAAALDAKESSNWAVWWLTRAGYVDIGQVHADESRAEQESVRNKIRAWWQDHGQEYPKAHEWDPSCLNSDSQ